MALIAIGSAKAAPGVTTLAVALAALAPGRPLLADLDPDGGDLALRYRRPDGAPLDPTVGLLSLAAALRGEPTTMIFGPTAAPPDGDQQGPVAGHLQTAAGGLDLLLGVSTPDQAIGLGPLWAPLARALADVPRPVFADCGRVGPASAALPVLMQADAVLMVARAELEELAHLRERLRFLLATLPRRSASGPRLGVVLVTADKDRAAAPRTEQLLRASGVPVPVLGTIADDPRGAAKLRGIGSGRAGRTTLVRSIRSLLPAVTALTADAEPPVAPVTAPIPVVVTPTPAPAVAPVVAEVGAPFEEPFTGPDPGPIEPIEDDDPPASAATSPEHPAGSAERPAGSAEHPAGSAEHPAGSAEHPAGSAGHPKGEDEPAAVLQGRGVR